MAKSGKRRIGLFVECSEAQRKLIQAAAESQGMKQKAFLLRAALKEVERIKQSMEAES